MTIAPLKARPLMAAVAAYMDVPVTAIKIEHDYGSLRKAIARAIRSYEREVGEANDND